MYHSQESSILKLVLKVPLTNYTTERKKIVFTRVSITQWQERGRPDRSSTDPRVFAPEKKKKKNNSRGLSDWELVQPRSEPCVSLVLKPFGNLPAIDQLLVPLRQKRDEPHAGKCQSLESWLSSLDLQASTRSKTSVRWRDSNKTLHSSAPLLACFGAELPTAVADDVMNMAGDEMKPRRGSSCNEATIFPDMAVLLSLASILSRFLARSMAAKQTGWTWNAGGWHCVASAPGILWSVSEVGPAATSPFPPVPSPPTILYIHLFFWSTLSVALLI